MAAQQNFGDLILILGDIHIPMRENKIPDDFINLLFPSGSAGKMHYVLCTGNLVSKEIHDFLKRCALSPTDVHVVKGDFDEQNFPEQKVLQIGQFRIGIIHGHQIKPWDKQCIANLQRKLDVDILISGNTHKNEVEWDDNTKKLYLNPGSFTGAFNNANDDVIPSFIILAICENKAISYIYELRNGEVEVKKLEHVKSRL